MSRRNPEYFFSAGGKIGRRQNTVSFSSWLQYAQTIEDDSSSPWISELTKEQNRIDFVIDFIESYRFSQNHRCWITFNCEPEKVLKAFRLLLEIRFYEKSLTKKLTRSISAQSTKAGLRIPFLYNANGTVKTDAEGNPMLLDLAELDAAIKAVAIHAIKTEKLSRDAFALLHIEYNEGTKQDAPAAALTFEILQATLAVVTDAKVTEDNADGDTDADGDSEMSCVAEIPSRPSTSASASKPYRPAVAFPALFQHPHIAPHQVASHVVRHSDAFSFYKNSLELISLERAPAQSQNLFCIRFYDPTRVKDNKPEHISVLIKQRGSEVYFHFLASTIPVANFQQRGLITHAFLDTELGPSYFIVAPNSNNEASLYIIVTTCINYINGGRNMLNQPETAIVAETINLILNPAVTRPRLTAISLASEPLLPRASGPAP